MSKVSDELKDLHERVTRMEERIKYMIALLGIVIGMLVLIARLAGKI